MELICWLIITGLTLAYGAYALRGVGTWKSAKINEARAMRNLRRMREGR